MKFFMGVLTGIIIFMLIAVLLVYIAQQSLFVQNKDQVSLVQNDKTNEIHNRTDWRNILKLEKSFSDTSFTEDYTEEIMNYYVLPCTEHTILKRNSIDENELIRMIELELHKNQKMLKENILKLNATMFMSSLNLEQRLYSYNEALDACKRK